MLGTGLEHVVLQTNKFHADVEQVLAKNPVDVVIRLIVIGADLRWVVAMITDQVVTGESVGGQAIGARVARANHAGNVKLRGKVQSCIPVLGVDEEARPAEARGIDQRRRKDVGLAQHRLIGRIVRRAANYRAYQKSGQPAQKNLLAHQAEVCAGFTEQTDYEIGRLLDAIHDFSQDDNTVVLWIFGNNGASAENGLDGHDTHTPAGKPKTIEEREDVAGLLGSELYSNHYAASWAWALNSPFVGTKQDASHLGGTTDPLVVSWPGHIKDPGAVRSQFSHVNDIAPTIYEITGAKFPEEVDGVKQIPLEGKSLVYTFDQANAPTRHMLQHFTTSGNRAIYKDGWWAGNRYRSTWEPNFYAPASDKDMDVRPWELYNLNEDFSQAHDLAGKYPEKLKELQQVFDSEAKRNNAYPILPARSTPLDAKLKNKTVFTFRSGVERLPLHFAPGLNGHTYTIDANLLVPTDGAEGVIVAEGDVQGGFSLFVKNNRIYYEVNTANDHADQLVASTPLRPGLQHVQVIVTPDSASLASASTTGVAPFAIRRPRAGQRQAHNQRHQRWRIALLEHLCK